MQLLRFYATWFTLFALLSNRLNCSYVPKDNGQDKQPVSQAITSNTRISESTGSVQDPGNVGHQEDSSDEDMPTLHEAVQAKEFLAVKTLVKTAPTTINSLDEHGKTPLNYAEVNTRIYQFLKEKGAKAAVELPVY